jgi:hypothetical protein
MQNDSDAQSNLRKLSGVKQEEQHRIIADLSKQIGTVKDDNDYERMIKEAQRRIKNIRDFASLKVKEYSDAGNDVDRVALAKAVFEKTMANFDHYDKDTLLMFLCQSFSEQILSEVV